MHQQLIQLPGATQLRDWMRRRGFETQAEVAGFFGINERFVSQYLNQESHPGLKHAVLIERKTGIPVEAWMSTEVDNSKEARKSRAKKSNIQKV